MEYETGLKISTLQKVAIATVGIIFVAVSLKAVAGLLREGTGILDDALPRVKTWKELQRFPAIWSAAQPEPKLEPKLTPLPPCCWPNPSTPWPTLTPTPTPTPTPCNVPGGRYPNIPVISLENLLACRPEAGVTIALILSDGPFPFARDDTPYFNDPPYLPPPSDPSHTNPTGYREYTVLTPSMVGRGARRIVTFGPGNRMASQYTVMYYTDDHYSTFAEIR